ncbi:MAG: serine/threonine-protein kinase, partial [Deltaproteobacteria bacterium]|nr:serine/threonine-protein kinase [Deltaproteobacteria bacterium]
MTCPFCGSDHPEGTFVCPNTNRRLQGLLPTGTCIEDKYRIEGIIGVGGMGVVYRAEQTKINRLVALKMLLPEYTVYPDLVARVEREARTAGQIDHPNVVTITDLGVTTEFGPYIAMELLRGQELATVVENAGGRMEPADAVDVIRQVLAGLEAAHKKGVIHRDLKPENIFLSTDDEGKRRVKVLDFGISKLRDDKELNSLTRTGTVMGTPQFMAPEQAAGARDQDARIDLYSTGAVLYAVLCNGLPYEAENYNLLISEILNKAPIQILQRNASLDPRLASIVMKSIAKKPEARYQSAREMAEALSYWFEHRNAPLPNTAPRNSSSRNIGLLSSDTPVFDLRRGVPRPPPLNAPELSPDDPEYLDRGEATVMVPVPFRGEEGGDVAPADDFYDDAGNAPRTMRPQHSPSRPSPPPSTPRRSPPPPEEPRVSMPEPSVLLESPLDAPPIVLFQAPKPPPSDETWAQLRTDVTPKRDVLMDEVHAERRSRSRGVYALMALAVLGLGVAAFRALSPTLWYRWVPGARDEQVVPPPPSTVSISDPVPYVRDAAVVVDVPVAAVVADVPVAAVVVAPLVDARVLVDAVAPAVDAPAVDARVVDAPVAPAVDATADVTAAPAGRR